VLFSIVTGIFVLISFPYHDDVKDFAASQAEAFRSNLKDWQPTRFFDDDMAADDVENQVGIAPSEVPVAPPSVPVEQHNPVAENWRLHLEQEQTPFNRSEHETNFGFSNIYILSHTRASERRKRMIQLAKALDIQIHFVDRTPPDSAKIAWIGERLLEVKFQKQVLLADALELDPDQIGHLGTNSPFLTPSVAWRKQDKPFMAESNLWLKANPISLPKAKFPSLVEDRFDGLDWLAYLESGNAIDPDDASFAAVELKESNEKDPELQLSLETIAEWYDHVQIFKRMMQNKDDNALVLDDRVDVEWDIARIWPNIKRRLPTTSTQEGFREWQAVFLGHCSKAESTRTLPHSCFMRLLRKRVDPAFYHPLLHHAADPRCLFGYALSRAGYTDLLRMLADPWIAYQTRLDVAIATMAQNQAFNVFTIEPPIIVQLSETLSTLSTKPAKEGASTIEESTYLSDSAMTRIWLYEGYQVTDRELRPSGRLSKSKYRITTAGNTKAKVKQRPLQVAVNIANTPNQDGQSPVKDEQEADFRAKQDAAREAIIHKAVEIAENKAGPVADFKKNKKPVFIGNH